MGQTKYNLNALSEKENDLIEVNKRIDYIFNRFKIIKNSVDTDIIRRDNISNQFNSLVSDFQNLVENTYNSSRIINRAITEYSDGEQQIHNLLNGLLGINNNSCGTEMNEIEHSEASISGFSILQNWFEKLYDQFISKVTHIKKFFEDNGVCVNNKDYSKTVVEDRDALKSGVLGDLEINTYSKLGSERIFRKAFEKESNYYDEDRIKKLQQYIREKGINVEVTGQLDRATFQAVNMIGIDELKENGFIQEDSYHSDGLNLYTYVQNNSINYCEPSGYCKESIEDYSYNEIEGVTKYFMFSEMFNMYDRKRYPYAHLTYLGSTYVLTEFKNGKQNDEILKNIAGLSDATYDVSKISSIFKSGDIAKGLYDSAMTSLGKTTSNKSIKYILEWSSTASQWTFILGILANAGAEYFNDKANIKELKYQSMLTVENSPYYFLIKNKEDRKSMLHLLSEKSAQQQDFINRNKDNMTNKEYFFEQQILKYINKIIDINQNYDASVAEIKYRVRNVKDIYYKAKKQKEWEDHKRWQSIYMPEPGHIS